MSGKRCHRWLDEEVIVFLQLYRNMECLWNNSLRDHRDKGKRELAYEIIKNQLGLDDVTVLDVKNKIKGIRTTYSDELNKVASSMKFTTKDVYKPKVFWFNLADSFLRRVTKNGIGTSMQKEDTSPYVLDETVHHNDTEEDQEYSEHNLVELPPHLPERLSPEHNTLNPILVNKEEDEYDLFGRSMAMQLRKMPELTALELMQKMQLMVLNSKKQLSKEKDKTKPKIAKLAAHAPSTSNISTKKVRTPSPDRSSNQSTPSPCYKYEVMSPSENSSCIREETGRDFTYVTTVEHTESFSLNSENIEDSLLVENQREGKRKLSNSIDPLEMKQSKLCGSRFMSS